MSVDTKQAAAFLRRKEARKREKNQQRLEKARADFSRIAEVVVQKYRPLRVYQWGSLLDASRFSEISDIDIAVEGLASAEQYFALLGDVMTLTDFPVDVVELDKIDPLHAESIRKYGRLIYDRNKPDSHTAGRDSENPDHP